MSKLFKYLEETTSDTDIQHRPHAHLVHNIKRVINILICFISEQMQVLRFQFQPLKLSAIWLIHINIAFQSGFAVNLHTEVKRHIHTLLGNRTAKANTNIRLYNVRLQSQVKDTWNLIYRIPSKGFKNPRLITSIHQFDTCIKRIMVIIKKTCSHNIATSNKQTGSHMERVLLAEGIEIEKYLTIYLMKLCFNLSISMITVDVIAHILVHLDAGEEVHACTKSAPFGNGCGNLNSDSISTHRDVTAKMSEDKIIFSLSLHAACCNEQQHDKESC